jgi:hypothetical protein
VAQSSAARSTQIIDVSLTIGCAGVTLDDVLIAIASMSVRCSSQWPPLLHGLPAHASNRLRAAS